MTNIQPIEIATKGTATKIEIVVMAFKLNPTDGIRMSYQLTDEQNNGLLGGTITIPMTVYEQWGVDDSYIVDYVLNELSLQKP